MGPVKYLLDTHALLWAVEGDERLGKEARRAVANCGSDELSISDISLLEIAMLERKGKIVLARKVSDYLTDLQCRFMTLPIGGRIAAESMNLELDQADPFDRVLVATAQYHRLPLITRDRRIRDSEIIETLW